MHWSVCLYGVYRRRYSLHFSYFLKVYQEKKEKIEALFTCLTFLLFLVHFIVALWVTHLNHFKREIENNFIVFSLSWSESDASCIRIIVSFLLLPVSSGCSLFVFIEWKIEKTISNDEEIKLKKKEVSGSLHFFFSLCTHFNQYSNQIVLGDPFNPPPLPFFVERRVLRRKEKKNTNRIHEK